MGWDREAINEFLANGGDIKEVDKFLLSGGKITRPDPVITPDDGKSDVHYGDYFPLENEYFAYQDCGTIHTWDDVRGPGGECPNLDWYDRHCR